MPPGLQPITGWNGSQVGRGEVLYPRYVPGHGTRMLPLRADQIPKGWQTVTARQSMRLATCEEAECPNQKRGWTRVVIADGNVEMMEGRVTPDEAAQRFGYFKGQPPAVFYQQPGTPCYSVHKLPIGIPPAYQVNGRWVLWNEFEDSIGGGVHRIQQITREGRY